MRSEDESPAGAASDGFLAAGVETASGAAKSSYFGKRELILLSSMIADSNAADSAKDAGFSSVFNAGILIGNSSVDLISAFSSTFFGFSTDLLIGSTDSSFCLVCTLCLSS